MATIVVSWQLVGPRQMAQPCPDQMQLFNLYMETVRELARLHDMETSALAQGQPNSENFDVMLQAARARFDQAKFVLLQHIQLHGC
jgi:hypothetical protein